MLSSFVTYAKHSVNAVPVNANGTGYLEPDFDQLLTDSARCENAALGDDTRY